MREAGQMEDIKRQVTGMKPDQTAGARSLNRVASPAFNIPSASNLDDSPWGTDDPETAQIGNQGGTDNNRVVTTVAMTMPGGTNVQQWDRHTTAATRKINFRLFAERRLASAPRLT